jgi:hypothetical protein
MKAKPFATTSRKYNTINSTSKNRTYFNFNIIHSIFAI